MSDAPSGSAVAAELHHDNAHVHKRDVFLCSVPGDGPEDAVGCTLDELCFFRILMWCKKK